MKWLIKERCRKNTISKICCLHTSAIILINNNFHIHLIKFHCDLYHNIIVLLFFALLQSAYYWFLFYNFIKNQRKVSYLSE